jgi:hypothetical protein
MTDLAVARCSQCGSELGRVDALGVWHRNDEGQDERIQRKQAVGRIDETMEWYDCGGWSMDDFYRGTLGGHPSRRVIGVTCAGRNCGTRYVSVIELDAAAAKAREELKPAKVTSKSLDEISHIHPRR